jgi:nucleoid DNA-binding protein
MASNADGHLFSIHTRMEGIRMAKAAKKAPSKAPSKATNKAPSKTDILKNISEATELSKKDVAAVLEALSEEIKKSLSSRGPGMFAIPGLIKIEKKKVPARPARKNASVRNIRTGETEIKDIPAKPAYTKVKVRALKSLKDMVK